jgi:hypothetical protein
VPGKWWVLAAGGAGEVVGAAPEPPAAGLKEAHIPYISEKIIVNTLSFSEDNSL